MKLVENFTVTDGAAVIFRADLAMRPLQRDEVIALHFMPSFVDARGTTVDGFVPGYTVDRVRDRTFGDNWLLVQPPGGIAFRFMPKFDWQPDQLYVVDQVSAYTLSIGLV